MPNASSAKSLLLSGPKAVIVVSTRRCCSSFSPRPSRTSTGSRVQPCGEQSATLVNNHHLSTIFPSAAVRDLITRRASSLGELQWAFASGRRLICSCRFFRSRASQMDLVAVETMADVVKTAPGSTAAGGDVSTLLHQHASPATSSPPPIAVPPEHVRHMTSLDRDKFTREIDVPCLSVTDVKISQVIKHLKAYLIKVERFKPVVSTGATTRFYLNPQIVSGWDDLSEDVRDLLTTLNVTQNNIAPETVTLSYENYRVEDVLRTVLPIDQEGMASYTKIGHIAHINLREHLLPYKHLIGHVLLDKVHGCRTVVNKAQIIDNTYRNFQLELLCGEENYNTEVRENGCRFQFDFSKVYWNSRLSTEHERIVQKMHKGDMLFDVFAGVGPFSIPAAKNGTLVYANDLNPESYKYLKKNASLNRVTGKQIKVFNLDGRDFIRDVFKKEYIKQLTESLTPPINVHITMNLPAMAVEFLDAFVGLFSDEDLEGICTFPVLYLYCFAKGEDFTELAREMVLKNFSWDVSEKIIDIYRVRTVSSMKEMVRVTINLDASILTGSGAKDGCGRGDGDSSTEPVLVASGIKRAISDDIGEADSNGKPHKKINNGEEQQEGSAEEECKDQQCL